MAVFTITVDDPNGVDTALLLPGDLFTHESSAGTSPTAGNVVYSLIFVREKAAQNPWRSKSIEWQVPTPVPVNNFEQIPVFDHDPYDYGTPPLPVGGPSAAGAGAGG